MLIISWYAASYIERNYRENIAQNYGMPQNFPPSEKGSCS